MIYRYVTESRVAKIEERTVRVFKKGSGDQAEYVDQSAGWWVTTEGPSPQTWCVGDLKPLYKVGDRAVLAMEVHS